MTLDINSQLATEAKETGGLILAYWPEAQKNGMPNWLPSFWDGDRWEVYNYALSDSQPTHVLPYPGDPS